MQTLTETVTFVMAEANTFGVTLTRVEVVREVLLEELLAQFELDMIADVLEQYADDYYDERDYQNDMMADYGNYYHIVDGYDDPYTTSADERYWDSLDYEDAYEGYEETELFAWIETGLMTAGMTEDELDVLQETLTLKQRK